jgi:signal transduction histidine kinase/GAF domain-containing protein
LADAAAQAADLAEKVAHVGSVVAREFHLSAVCDVVLDETIRTLGAQWATLHLADEDKRILKLVGERRVPGDLVDRLSQLSFDTRSTLTEAARSRQMRIISEEDELEPSPLLARELLSRTGCKTLIELPLLAHDQLVAVLSFALKDAHTFTAGERATLDSCGHVFSFAIAHAMLFEEERRLHTLFEAVGQAAVAISSELDLLPVLQNIVDQARFIADADYAALGILVSEDQPFEPFVYSGITQEQAGEIGGTPRPVGILGAFVANDHSIRVADVRQHPAFGRLPAHHPEITSFMGVPVNFDGRSLGNLYIANKRSEGGFSAEDQKAIELLAAHAGAVVHQRRVRKQLEAERARFKAIVESAPHGVVFIEPSSGTVVANARAVELTGHIFFPHGHEGALMTPDGTAVPQEDWPFPRAMRGETVKPQEFLFRHPDGREVPVLVSAAPIRELGPQGTVVLFEDISAVKQLQRLREQWASIVAHELRQPLTILGTSINLLLEMSPAPQSELYKSLLARTQKAAMSLSRLVDDLASVTLVETKHLKLKRQPLHLDALVRTLVEDHQARSPNRVIALQIAERIPLVDADPIRMEQVLSNLLSNALKYSPPRSKVDVALHVVEREVRVLVTNQGPGLRAEELTKIFDRYYRTPRAGASEAPGLGLGLYVAKGIVEAHGGRIWAESRPGEATTVQFALPACEDA